MIKKTFVCKTKKMSTTECDICCEKFNKSTHFPVNCPQCSHIYCRKCIKEYFLTIEFPQCMNCKKPWSYEYICSVLTKSFVMKEWEQHKRDILVDIEMGKIPDTISKMEAEKERNEKIENIYREISRLNIELQQLKFSTKVERKEFKHPCPQNNCRGFLSTKWKCCICNVYVCKDCFEVLEEDHKCDEEKIKSINVIKKDSKPCPTCGARIHRLSGCNSMWCSNCKVGFDWVSGKIKQGDAGNPHYYEWLRDRNTAVNNEIESDVVENFECNNQLDYDSISKMLKDQCVDSQIKRTVQLVLILVNEIRNHHLPRYSYRNDDNENEKLRRKYINNKIDKKTMKQYLGRLERKKEKNRVVYQILEMTTNVFVDLINRLVEQHKRLIEKSINKATFKIEADKIYNEMDELRKYSSKSIRDVMTLMNYKKCIVITENFSIKSLL